MQAFHIHYRNTQGTLMRILNAASRRGIDLPYVQASPAQYAYTVTLLLEVSPKQVGQLCREWHAITDVTDVRAASSLAEKAIGGWVDRYPSVSVAPAGNQAARSAMA